MKIVLLILDIRRWQAYLEPGDNVESGGGSTSPTKRISRNLEHDEEFSQLPENTLTRNLGLDLIVVVSKVNFLPYI